MAIIETWNAWRRKLAQKSSAFVELVAEGLEIIRNWWAGKDKKYLLIINDRLADEVLRLHDEVKYLRAQNDLLLGKMLNKPERPKIDMTGMEPIGGFVPLRSKIADLERKSRIEAAKLQDNEDAN
jgi:hypothetical protein